MANKFLPFIVEKSTPINIYQTLLSRSKGMNVLLVTSIFYLVVSKGILEVRKFVKTLPELQLEELYTAIMEGFPNFRIQDDEFKLYTSFARHTDKNRNWSRELGEFTIFDTFAFFLVMSKVDRLHEVTDMPFDKVVADKEGILNNIQKYVLFSDSAEVKEFYNSIDLQAYILYQALLTTYNHEDGYIPISVRAVFSMKKTT